MVNLNLISMEKYIFKDTGKEVKVGDTISCTLKGAHFESSAIVTLDETTFNEFVKRGIIIAVKEEKLHDISYYIMLLSKRFGCPLTVMAKSLSTIAAIYPMSAFNIILREIAIDLDKAYPDHIRNSEKIYSISSINGKITEVNKAHIRNYKNFAAFRSIADARKACRITRDLLKDLFKNE